jgi:hypothetical protein
MDTRSHNGLIATGTAASPDFRLRNCRRGLHLLRSGRLQPTLRPRPRVAVFVNAQSHSTRAFKTTDYPFMSGGGVVYFPTDRVAEVPASTLTTTQTAYGAVDGQVETQNYSLWSERRTRSWPGQHRSSSTITSGRSAPTRLHLKYRLRPTVLPVPFQPGRSALGHQGHGARASGRMAQSSSLGLVAHISCRRRRLGTSTPAWSRAAGRTTPTANIYWDDAPWVAVPGFRRAPAGCPKTGRAQVVARRGRCRAALEFRRTRPRKSQEKPPRGRSRQTTSGDTVEDR